MRGVRGFSKGRSVRGEGVPTNTMRAGGVAKGRSVRGEGVPTNTMRAGGVAKGQVTTRKVSGVLTHERS
jgi:hypothetical protein